MRQQITEEYATQLNKLNVLELILQHISDFTTPKNMESNISLIPRKPPRKWGQTMVNGKI